MSLIKTIVIIISFALFSKAHKINTCASQSKCLEVHVITDPPNNDQLCLRYIEADDCTKNPECISWGCVLAVAAEDNQKECWDVTDEICEEIDCDLDKQIAQFLIHDGPLCQDIEWDYNWINAIEYEQG